MGLIIEYLPGQTPLDEDEKEGLKIRTISTHQELNEFEQQNIEQAIVWYLSHNFKSENVVTETFIRAMHKRMYGDVWKWAGEFRKTNKNIGVDKWSISTALEILSGDTLHWIANDTFSADEIAIRFKHRLVSIHCFPNGNGRHSRLMADLLISKISGREPFSWGASNLSLPGDTRKKYLAALKAADRHEISLLVNFARS
jgi:Fic-DOC domain mobile mystery protein B